MDVGLIHIIYNIFNYNNTILYIIILYIAKNEKIKKNPLKKVVIFSHVFLLILYTIGLYIYIIKYRFSIKILDFLRNILKVFFKKTQNLN